jgi:hypothetical protein
MKIKWARHVARKGYRRGAHRVLERDPREGDDLEDLGVEGRIILTEIFRKWDRGS